MVGRTPSGDPDHRHHDHERPINNEGERDKFPESGKEAKVKREREREREGAFLQLIVPRDRPKQSPESVSKTSLLLYG